MSKEMLLAQITANPKLPSPSNITFQILEKVNSPRCTIVDLSRLISQDPGLCGKLLKIVNSSLFGMPRAVTSVQMAVTLLGLKRVQSLILSLSLPGMHGNSGARQQGQRFWKLAVASSIVARELAVRLRWPDPDGEMVSGLLCDLGVLILQEAFPEKYALVEAEIAAADVKAQCALEEQHFGVSHADVSTYILRSWRLPNEISQPILYHHTPELAPKGIQDRAYLLYFAHRLAQLQLTVDLDVGVGEIMTLASERFHLSDREFQDFLEPLGDRIQEFSQLLDIDVGGRASFPSMLARATQSLSRIAEETSLDNVRVEGEKQLAQAELKKTEEALQKAEEKLRQAVKMEAIGRLAGGVAHDFNNLLTIINGCSELVLSTLSAQDSNRVFLEEVKKAGERASELTHQLLAFSRKQILVPKVVSLNQIVGGMEKMLGRLIGEDVVLATSLAPKLDLVLVDPGQMDQVIMNLVLNARDAMPRGGKLLLETRPFELDETYVQDIPGLKAGHFIQLAISDTGTGMSPETRAKIFEPFFTTKGEGLGTGLGLATVHGIISQSGGHVAVYSEIGRGTTFKVYLPALADPSQYAEPVAKPTQSKMGNETILLAEDEESVRRTMRRMLETFGYQILEAADGIEALDVSRGYPARIHLLVTDTIMPNLGGSDLAAQLKIDRPDMQVLFTSGYTDDAVLRHGVLTSEVAFLQKPFTASALAAKVREVLQTGTPAPSAPAAFAPPPVYCDSMMSPG